MFNTKISRLKLKDSKFFSSQINKQKQISKYISAGLTPKRSSKNLVLLTELKTEKNDLNSFLTSQKMNIKKKLNHNKTELLLPDNKITQTNNYKMNKTFYKINIPMNKVKSFSDLNSNLHKSNYSSHMTQTSESFFNNKQTNKYKNLRKIQKIQNLELNQSYNDNKSNNVTYIDYHINQILTKKKEKINYKINNHKELFNNKNISGLLLNLNVSKRSNNKNHNIENSKYFNNEKDKEKEKKIDNRFHINKIYFQDELENLFHKIIIIKNNKKEFENFVMSLTNEELKLLYENQNILPLLIKNRSINYQMKEYEKSNSKSKEDKKIEELKSINFQNNILNLFLKGNKIPKNKDKPKNFPNISKYETDKNNSFSNYDINKDNQNEIPKKNNLSKSQIYKKINMMRKKEENDEDIMLKKDLEFLGYKNRLNVNIYNKEEIKKGEKIWEKWIKDVMDKNKDKYVKHDKHNCNKVSCLLNNKRKKEEEEEFKKILFKKIIRQNSFKVINNIMEEKNDLFILPQDIEKINKENNNSHNNKSLIINEERIFNRIKKKFSINIISYIHTPHGKLSLKLFFNPIEEKNEIVNKKINSNQAKNKLLFESFLPFEDKNNKTSNILNPYIISEEQNDSEKSEDTEKETEENNNNENFMKNLEHLPISLKKFFLEKYKVTEQGRYSRLNINELRGQKRKKKKVIKNIPKKIVIKVDNHNEKMVNNYINKLVTNKDKEKKPKKKKINENIKKNKEKENEEIIIKKKDEKRIINLFGINITIKKRITPIQHLRDYMYKKGITSSEEFKSQIKLKNNITKLIAKLKIEQKKKKRKTKQINRQNLSKLLDINYNQDDLVKLANDGVTPVFSQSKRLRFFDTKLMTRKDVEKRKMQLLLKFKNDIDYRAMKGEVDETELNMFTKLEEKIDKLMDLINIKEYVAKMEDYIGEFQEEINLREKSRKDEKRINGFIEKLKEDIDYKINRKDFLVNRYGKVFNFNYINHINDLNGII